MLANKASALHSLIYYYHGMCIIHRRLAQEVQTETIIVVDVGSQTDIQGMSADKASIHIHSLQWHSHNTAPAYAGGTDHDY